ncbi:MAG: hypothetical protein QOE09_1312 [Ilumatobacteraceae bacterium]
MPIARELPSLRGSELDELFAKAPAGDVPAGKGRGQALVGSGTLAARPFLATTRLMAWQGKMFDPASHTLRNLITPFGVRAITADVYVDASLLDGRPCIVLDYSKTSRIAGWVRDEIREIGPGLYLGLVYAGSRRLPIRFSLAFDSADLAMRTGVVDVDHEPAPT